MMVCYILPLHALLLHYDNHEAGDLRCHRTHYDIIVMVWSGPWAGPHGKRWGLNKGMWPTASPMPRLVAKSVTQSEMWPFIAMIQVLHDIYHTTLWYDKEYKIETCIKEILVLKPSTTALPNCCKTRNIKYKNITWSGNLWTHHNQPCTIHKRLSLNMRGLKYPWLLASPGHQQPWYWLCTISKSLS